MAIDRLTSSAIPSGKVTSLAHELRNNTVETTPFEPQSLTGATDAVFSSAKSTKVFGRLGNNIFEELHLHTPSRLRADRNIKEHQRILRVYGVERNFALSAKKGAAEHLDLKAKGAVIVEIVVTEIACSFFLPTCTGTKNIKKYICIDAVAKTKKEKD